MDIYQLFQQAYNREAYLDFLKHDLLAEDFYIDEEEIQYDDLGFTPLKIESLTYLGQSEKLGVSVYEAKHSSHYDARVTISREIFKLMAYMGDRRALVLFIPPENINYRLSLVTMDLIASGKRIMKEFSNPRRYSFYLGEQAKVHTPSKQLKNRMYDFNDLQKAFSLEVVNEDFFNDIAKLFTKLTGGKRDKVDYQPLFRLPSQGDSLESKKRLKEFGVRLIGRIIFCWFLKKKESKKGLPLISEEILSKQAVELNSNYYHTILEKLFFRTLNTPIEDRNKDIRALDKWNSIPFLNGGLFDPHNHDHFSEKHAFDNVLKISDAWFKELFELLEMYNFTIDESTPVDVDLSVDPEMIGRIFENLLAEINPETGETARKSTGSFYTPRSIVEFMGNESIVEYLKEKTSIGEEKLRNLIDYAQEVPELSNHEIEAIVDAFYHLKIMDPACGSSAFPMGILQSMSMVLEKIDPDALYWVIKKIDGIKDPDQKKLVEDKLINEDYRYLRKLGILQRCLYGVDIQQMAVDISKLRFFLTLIVDETIDDEKENRGIHPLPNLSFKFVCANTLISLPDIEDQSQVDVFGSSISPTLLLLEKLRESFFTCYGKEKEVEKEKFKDLQAKIQSQLLQYNYASNQKAAKLLSYWDPFGDYQTNWFDARWMFGIENGFDIVIGNPPYIQLQKDFDGKQKFADLYKNEGYQTFARTGDIYCLFYEQGIEILKQDGVLCFITSNKWMRANYGKPLRKYLSSKNPLTLLDLGPGVFNAATVDTNILLVRNREVNNHNLKAIALKKKQKNHVLKNLDYLHLKKLGEESWIILTPKEQKIKDKIERIGTPLKDWDVKINYGIKTGYNEAFIIDGPTKDRLIAEDPNSAEIIKPILRGRDIKRYKAEFADKWLILVKFGDYKNLSQKYPAIYNHLLRYKAKLQKRGQCSYSRNKLQNNKKEYPGQHHWLELDNNPQEQYVEEFGKEKIVFQEMVQVSTFSYDTEGYFCNDTGRIITGESIKYLLSVLNAKAFFIFIKKFYGGGELGEKGVRMKHTFIEKCPIPIPGTKIKEKLELIINEILKKIDNGISTQLEEKKIDIIIYHLYQLNYDEVLIVDPGFVDVMNREEYERYEVE